MAVMEFNFLDFSGANIKYPQNFNEPSSLDRARVLQFEQDHSNDQNQFQYCMDRLKERTTDEYFRKVNSAQNAAMDYSRSVFPAYKYILPEVITEDWLSMVDWHKKRPTRDHSVHQPLTAYVVAKLLGYGDSSLSLDTPSGKLLDKCVEVLLQSPGTEYLRNYFTRLYPGFTTMPMEHKTMWAKNMFYEAAIISALFHDMGYPWQYINKLSLNLTEANYTDGTTPLAEGDKLLNQIQGHLLEYPFYEYQPFTPMQSQNRMGFEIKTILKESFLKTHGFPGALGFITLNSKLRKTPAQDNLQESTLHFILEWASVAIMMHDMAGYYRGETEGAIANPYLRIHFDIDPLSCVIALSDVLEEFERPKATFKQGMPIDYSFTCKGTEVDASSGVFKVVYKFSTNEEVRDSSESRKGEISDYLNPNDGFLDLSCLGIIDQDCTCALG